MDVTDSGIRGVDTKTIIPQSDVFTLSYFISELYRFRSSAEPFFHNTFSMAKPGSLILFIDNADSRFYGWFDYMTGRYDFETIQTGERSFEFSNEEEKRDLGEYFDKFGWPRRRAEASFRVLRKN